MPFLAFKVADYEYTAEREQYRAVCSILKDYFSDREDLCVFLANVNLNDCELDGLLIKPDAIIGIEFKNYGGEITASENGDWLLDNKIRIKGGSNKTVYQQAKLNHIAIKQGLREFTRLSEKEFRFIPALVVFFQPIVIKNLLCQKVKSWLHICDMDTFMNKVEDLTSTGLNLSTEQIVELLANLNIRLEFLDKRFSQQLKLNDNPATKVSDIELSINGEDENLYVTKKSNKQSKVASSENEPLKTFESRSNLCEHQEDDECEGYKQFILKNIVPLLDIKEEITIRVEHNDTSSLFYPTLNNEYLIFLEVLHSSQYQSLIERIIHKKTINRGNLIIWGEGDPIKTNDAAIQFKSSLSPSLVEYHLPDWLENFLFENLKSKYAPSFSQFASNLDLTMQESKIYLGTYFPRSFSESKYIFDKIFSSQVLKHFLSKTDELSVLDFGCGSGGEIFGLASSIKNNLKNVKILTVFGIDGNTNSLHLFEEISKKHNQINELKIQTKIFPIKFDSSLDIEEIVPYLKKKFDIIISFKALGEFQNERTVEGNVYEYFTALFFSLLAENGFMILEDVTVKDGTNYRSETINQGVNSYLTRNQDEAVSLAPCSGIINNRICTRRCFQKREILVSHKLKHNDLSKFAFRVLARKKLSPVTLELSNFFEDLPCKKGKTFSKYEDKIPQENFLA